MRRIALTLNAECAPAPRAQRGRPSAWCPSSVFEVLRRDLYHGLIVWNRSQKRDAWGQTKVRPRVAADWIEHRAESLRIVPDALWQRAHAALERRRQAYLSSTQGQRHGRPVVGKPSKYLLTGFCECGTCHGALIVRTSSRGKKRRVPMLACWHYSTRGPRACTNKTEMPLEAATSKILDAIQARLLDPVVVEMMIAFAVELLREAAGDHDASAGRAAETIAALDVEAKRLVGLTAAGVGDLPAVVERLQAIKDQRTALTRILMVDQRPTNVDELEVTVRARVEQWRQAFTRRAPEAKPILEGLLDGRIVIAPRSEAGVFDVRIPLKTTGLLEGVISPKALASPTSLGRSRLDVDLVFRPKAA